MREAAKTYASHYTISEWERWLDQWEIIDGVPYCMNPAPSARHQNINLNIASNLREGLKKRPCKRSKVYLPIDWQISDDTLVQPDVLVVCKPILGKRLTEAPEAVFEILSESTQKKDRTEKFDLYKAQKVKYYTMVNPEGELVEIFILDENGVYRLVDFDSVFSYKFSECEVELDFREIWE